MTEKERQEVLARLAASETASLMDTSISTSAEADKIAAMSRIIGDLNVPILQAKHVYQKMISQLQNADLTINFKAYKFFNSAPKGKGYVSQFEGGNKWGDASYFTTRDETEEKMFDYSNASKRTGPAAVINRVRTLGRYNSGNNTTFQSSIRPKYGALNFAGFKHGSAENWGKSYVILKEHTKHNATFIQTDSFDVVSLEKIVKKTIGEQMANYSNMQRLLVNMPLNMLQALHSASCGQTFQINNLGDHGYIESHVHAGVQFDRDVAKICIANSEVNECEAKLKTIVASEPKKFKVITSKQLRDTFTAFSRKYNIPVVYV